MTKSFGIILQMSVFASVLILAVMILRIVFGNLSKKYISLLWGLVLFRLLCPVFIESEFSLIPFNRMEEMDASPSDINLKDPVGVINGLKTNNESSAGGQKVGIPAENEDGARNSTNTGAGTNQGMEDDIPGEGSNSRDIHQDQKDEASGRDFENGNGTVQSPNSKAEENIDDKGLTADEPARQDNTAGDGIEENQNPQEKAEKYRISRSTVILIFSVVWLVGVILMAGWHIVLYFKIKRRLATAIRANKNVWESDGIDSPFVMGFVKPKIYLPFGITGDARDYIIRHENNHVRHLDPQLRVIQIFALCIHWWNPLVWIAVHQMNQDREMLCDEAVIKDVTIESRAEYSSTLLRFAMKQSGYLVIMPFGESNTENRIKHILKFKKPVVLIRILLIAFILICAAGFLTIPKSEGSDRKPDETASDNIEADNTEKNDFDSDMADVPDNREEEKEEAEETGLNASWKKEISKHGMDELEQQIWYSRVTEDIPDITEDFKIADLYYEDVDKNGVKDLFVLIKTDNDITKPEDYPSGYLAIYMNDDPAHIKKYTDGIFFFRQIIVEDIDRDGLLEILFVIENGGVGANGSVLNALYKYKENQMISMKLPTYDPSMYDENEGGYPVEVRYAKDENEYIAECEPLNGSMRTTVKFYADYEEEKDMSRYRQENQSAGGSIRGFTEFTVVYRKDGAYLLAKEYLAGEYGTNHFLGWATFLLDWDKKGEPYVLEFDVEPKGFYILTKAIVVEKRKLALELYGTKFEDSEEYGIYKIDVLENGKKLQELYVEPAVTQEKGEAAGEGYITTKAWYKDGGLRTEDVNFDGSGDIGLMGWIPAADNLPYYYWIWNSDTQEFEYAFSLPNLMIEPKNEFIISNRVLGRQGYEMTYYRYADDNRTLTEVKRLKEKLNEDTGKLMVEESEFIDGEWKKTVDAYYKDVNEYNDQHSEYSE